MKAKLIVMLTLNDVTVENAIDVFESCKDLPVDDWGFKNVGMDETKRAVLAQAMKAAGKNVYIEDVQHNEEAVLKMAMFADKYGVGNICSRYYPSVHEYVKSREIKYYAGSTMSSGSPVMLRGAIDTITEQLKGYMEKGIAGICIGAYRHESSPEALVQSLVKNIKGNIIIAGSIDSEERMRYVNDAGCFAFTMGSAIFNKKYIPNGSFRENLIEVLHIMDRI